MPSNCDDRMGLHAHNSLPPWYTGRSACSAFVSVAISVPLSARPCTLVRSDHILIRTNIFARLPLIGLYLLGVGCTHTLHMRLMFGCNVELA
jgi:hypothetical protein